MRWRQTNTPIFSSLRRKGLSVYRLRATGYFASSTRLGRWASIVSYSRM